MTTIQLATAAPFDPSTSARDTHSHASFLTSPHAHHATVFCGAFPAFTFRRPDLDRPNGGRRARCSAGRRAQAKARRGVMPGGGDGEEWEWTDQVGRRNKRSRSSMETDSEDEDMVTTSTTPYATAVPGTGTAATAMEEEEFQRPRDALQASGSGVYKHQFDSDPTLAHSNINTFTPIRPLNHSNQGTPSPFTFQPAGLPTGLPFLSPAFLGQPWPSSHHGSRTTSTRSQEERPKKAAMTQDQIARQTSVVPLPHLQPINPHEFDIRTDNGSPGPGQVPAEDMVEPPTPGPTLPLEPEELAQDEQWRHSSGEPDPCGIPLDGPSEPQWGPVEGDADPSTSFTGEGMIPLSSHPRPTRNGIHSGASGPDSQDVETDAGWGTAEPVQSPDDAWAVHTPEANLPMTFGDRCASCGVVPEQWGNSQVPSGGKYMTLGPSGGPLMLRLCDTKRDVSCHACVVTLSKCHSCPAFVCQNCRADCSSCMNGFCQQCAASGAGYVPEIFFYCLPYRVCVSAPNPNVRGAGIAVLVGPAWSSSRGEPADWNRLNRIFFVCCLFGIRVLVSSGSPRFHTGIARGVSTLR